LTNQWFRSWHGAPTDPKWLGIARKAGVAPGIVSALVWALLDRASQATERGSIAGYDADGLACFMGCEPEQVEHIIALMHEKEILADNTFTGWEKHQPRREDGSAERAKDWRERKRTQPNASEQEQTLDTDTDTDTEEDISARAAPETKPVRKVSQEEPYGFEEFWGAYPKRDGSPDRKGAAKAFKTALRRATLETILDGTDHFREAMTARGKIGTEFIPQARTWLNGDRWNERYDTSTAADSKQAQNLAILEKYRAASRS
jgi:hypothetical protein